MNFSLNQMLSHLVLASIFCARVAMADGFGFAAGVTGGGNARPDIPQNPWELVRLLEDNVPRVILLDKDFNFKGSMGIKPGANGCIPDSNRCGIHGQNAIDLGFGWCGNQPYTRVTYDVAATVPIFVKSHKTLRGINGRGKIIGKGLRLQDASNVMIQNVHILDLNPMFIWGGDAIAIAGRSDMIWINNNRFTIIGRQMIGISSGQGRRITISHNEFNGVTPWSASCNGKHYWTLLIVGNGDMITLSNNWFHDISGRGPKITGNAMVHAYNNRWDNVDGHAFDLEGSIGPILIEGNVFNNVKVTQQPDRQGGSVSCARGIDMDTVRRALGRNCMANTYVNSPYLRGHSAESLLILAGRNLPRARYFNRNAWPSAGWGVPLL